MPKGSCLCKKIQYEYPTPSQPLNCICHCPSCSKITSSAFSTCASIPKTSLSIITGSEHLKTFSAPHDPTGMMLTIHFCKECATTLWKEAESEELKGVAIVFTGTLDLEEGAGEGKGMRGVDVEEPGHELWVGYRARWLAGLKGAKQWEGFPEA